MSLLGIASDSYFVTTVDRSSSHHTHSAAGGQCRSWRTLHTVRKMSANDMTLTVGISAEYEYLNLAQSLLPGTI